MVEVALVAPILIFIFIAIAQFGYVFYVQSSLQSAARSAARQGSVAPANFVTASSPIVAAAEVPSGYTSCSSSTVTGAASNATPEKLACYYISSSNLPGALSAYEVWGGMIDGGDGADVSDPSDDPSDFVQVYLRVPLSNVVFVDYNNFLSGTRHISVNVTMPVQL